MGEARPSRRPRPAPAPVPGQPALSLRDLRRVAAFVDGEVGIQLPDTKQTLVEGRLRKRLRALGYHDFTAYLDHVLEDPEGRHERLHLIDALTTNKTEFFREPAHFRYLVEQALPVMEANRLRDGRRKLGLWSAGCSTGEEPYTLAMVLNEARESRPDLRFGILATDISNSCLETARRAVYPEGRIAPVPMALRRKYLLRSRDPGEGLVQMGPALRRCVRFGGLNLTAERFRLEQPMDAIFCRNVMIYFDGPTRSRLVQRFEQQLVPGGYLFVGHSESLNGLDSQLVQVAPMVYQRPGRGDLRKGAQRP